MALNVDPETGLPYGDSGAPGGVPGQSPTGLPTSGQPSTDPSGLQGQLDQALSTVTSTAQNSGDYWNNYSGDPNDPNAINQFIGYLSGLPDADPTLKTDPGYWAGVFKDKGGLTPANIGYFQTRATNAGNAAHAAGDASAQTPGSFQQPAPFQTPTLQDLLNSPGYQANLKAGEDVLQNSAAAKGTLLTGGTLKDLNQFAQNYATTNYQNLFNNALQTNQTNFGQSLAGNNQNFQQLYGLSSLGLGAANSENALIGAYGANASGLLTGIGNSQAAGTIGGANATAGGLNNLGSLAQYYSLFGL